MKAAKSTFNKQHCKSWTLGNSGQKVQLGKVYKLILKWFEYDLLRDAEQTLMLSFIYKSFAMKQNEKSTWTDALDNNSDQNT